MSTTMVPKNKDIEGFDINISGAQYIRELLVQLASIEPASRGAILYNTYISGTGGGNYIKKQVSVILGSALDSALKRDLIYSEEVSDRSMAGGKHDIPRVLHNCSPIGRLTRPGKELSRSDKKWLKRLADFWTTCNGFHMY
jgi:hypothetical protein